MPQDMFVSGLPAWCGCIGAKKRELKLNAELSESVEYFAQTAENNFDQTSLLLLLSLIFVMIIFIS